MTTLLNINPNTVAEQATNAANRAKDAFLAKWKESTGGNEYGEPMYCGFGWVQCTPEHKGNTKLVTLSITIIQATKVKN